MYYGLYFEQEAKWFRDALIKLKLSQKECAELLQVSTRTIRRWARTGVRKPSPAYRAIEAWLKCEKHGIDWRSL